MTEDQAQYVYEAVQSGRPVQPYVFNVDIDQLTSLSEDVNPYHAGLHARVDTELFHEPLLEMDQCDLHWSILSTHVEYTMHKDLDNPFRSMNASNLYDRLEKSDNLIEGPTEMGDERFEEVTCCLKASSYYDDTNDVSTTYLGTYLDENKPRTFNFENHIPMDGRGMARANLMDQTPLKVFFDSGATRSYLSHTFYKATKTLHNLPKFTTTCTGIKIGNGSIVQVLFVIPLLFMCHGHVFEIYTIVADIDDGIDLVFGFKNMVETEGMLNTRTGEFDFLGRSIPIFPQHDLDVKPGGKAYLKVKMPFVEKLSGRALCKMFAGEINHTLKLKVQDNQAVVEFENRSDKTVKLRKVEVLGVLDLRSMGYFKAGYQRMVTMTESSGNFLMHHYQQIAKGKPKEECGLYLKISTDRGPPRNTTLKSESPRREPWEDPYPWLAEDDPRRFQSDAEILFEKIDLKDSALTKREKAKLMKMILKYRDAFSLRDEIGACPNLTADIKVIDESPFFVRPFPLSEGDKPFMDKQMERLVSLGILSKNSTSHTSPVMLITRKLTNDKHPVVDFRLLNTRILRRNTSIPLMSDVLSILGNSECEVVSCVDIKDAYHSIPLTERSKEYCGILPYFGSPIYRYKVLPMGIACAPQIWMDYITLILGELEDKSKYIAIMDDLLVHSSKAAHWRLLEQLFKAMCKNGLKLSPKKCQLFKTKLTYMGNEFVIVEKNMTITPLRSRTEALHKIPTPRTAKQCKSFCGFVNYLSLFCPDLQILLRPIVELTRKERPFVWGKEQETAFIEVKKRLTNPPVLHLPKAEGRFILYSDTSKEGTGSSLWQIKEGKPKLLGYASKTLPEACARYSATELEMTGLLVNMNLWKNLLKHREFDAAVDHVAVTQILKAKTEPATTRIMKLLDRLAAYSFNLYYVKGRDMIMADYLSRHRTKDSDTSELIPISFCPLTSYYKSLEENAYCIGTRASAKAAGEIAPRVHGADKPLNPNLKPEHQGRRTNTTGSQHKIPLRAVQNASSTPAPKTTRTSITATIRESADRTEAPGAISSRKVWAPPLAQPSISAPSGHIDRGFQPRPPMERGENADDDEIKRITTKYAKVLDPRPIPGIDIGAEEEVLDPEIQIPQLKDFIPPQSLDKVVDLSKTAYKFLPKQGEIDRLLKQIEKKVLRDINISNELRDLKAAYMESPHFRDIYINLMSGKVPFNKGAARRMENSVRDYMTLDGLLFKIVPCRKDDYETVLCIPTSKAHILMDMYHSSLIGGHTGITKCYQTICRRFYCPNLAEQLRAYITGCHTCQMFKKGKQFQRPYQKRINLNVPAMRRISMDMKQMPPCNGYTHILVLLCEVSHYMVALPLHSTRTQHILEVFQKGYMAYFGPPSHIICDQDPAFTSSLMEASALKLNISIILVSPTNHKFLQAEHGIKSLSGLLVKHLSEQWNWVSCLSYSSLCYNCYDSPNLDGHSPYELVFGHKMLISPKLEIQPEVVVSGTFKEYYERLNKNLRYLGERLEKFRSTRLDLLNKDRKPHSFQVGQLVYMFQARGAMVRSTSRKINTYYVGPLVIYKAIGPNQFLLMSLDGIIYPKLIEESRLKAGSLWTHKGKVTTLAELRHALSPNMTIESP